MSDQTLIIHLRLPDETNDEDDLIDDLEDELEEAVENADVGEFDGSEYAEDECILYFYGPDVNALWTVVEPLLRGSPVSKGARIIKRFGEEEDVNARNEELNFQ